MLNFCLKWWENGLCLLLNAAIGVSSPILPTASLPSLSIGFITCSFTSRVIFYGEDKENKDDKDEDKIIFNQNSEEIFEVILPKKRMKITSVESLFEKKN